MGGNSTKATSGINGALTRTQTELEIRDSVKQFYDDTLKSARDKARPELIKVLTYKSAAAVEWLMDEFNLDLTLVSRLGYVLKHNNNFTQRLTPMFQRSLPTAYPPRSRCQVPRHGHHLCSDGTL
jgi:succinate dehydrogenase/fumarate reductase flavoprotein subunit